MLYEVFPGLDVVSGRELCVVWVCVWFDVCEVLGYLCEEGGFGGYVVFLCKCFDGVVWSVC